MLVVECKGLESGAEVSIRSQRFKRKAARVAERETAHNERDAQDVEAVNTKRCNSMPKC